MSSPQKDNILLFGATGYIGAYILQQLVAAKHNFGRIAIFTSRETAQKKPSLLQAYKLDGVETIIGDVRNAEDIVNAFQGIDVAISAVGRNVISEQINWIELAEKSLVKRFFPSEFGTDIEYGPESIHEIPYQQKLKVTDALRKTSRLEYACIVTGPYADGVEPAFFGPCAAALEIGSYEVKTKTAILIGDGTGKISFTSPQDVGMLVVQALLHPQQSKNKALKVNSFTTTPKQILHAFEKQCGGEKWTAKYTSNDELRDLEKTAWSNKHPMAPIFTLRRIWSEGGTLHENQDNELIGAGETQTLEEAVSAAIRTQLSGDIDSQKDRRFM